MIVLDTNVLSESFKPKPSDVVMRWLDAQERPATFTTSITQAEVLYGIQTLPQGKRRWNLASAVSRIFAEEFEGRILAFDESAARAYAEIVPKRQSTGSPISPFDGMIAAIARSQRAVLATRNISDFKGCGIEIVDPWKLYLT